MTHSTALLIPYIAAMGLDGEDVERIGGTELNIHKWERLWHFCRESPLLIFADFPPGLQLL